MHLPDYYSITVKSLISIMFVADFDTLDHLARQFLDPLTSFVAQNHITVNGKKRFVEILVSGVEALDYAIDLVNGLSSERYKHVRAALRKVRGD
jgi:hypothetical protein